MKWFITLILLSVLILPVPGFPLEGQEIFDTWQKRFIIPESEGKILDVPYVVTEDYISERMFKLLELRPGDVLYDLGCGDGRLVIGAVKHPGVRGVGIDIDPRRIAESKANALAAGLTDRTLFIQQDLFESDFRDATAVTLFLLPELNVKLRPRLFQDLKAGTRIVSHNFDMGEWKADKTVFAGLWFDGTHYLHYWIIPANVSGRWQWRTNKNHWSLSLTQRFQKVEGSLSMNGGPAMPLSHAAVTGGKIRFVAQPAKPLPSITFEGTIKGNTMEGTALHTSGPPSPWRAQRDPGTMAAIY